MPEGGALLPLTGTGEGMSEVGITPSTVAVIVGKTVAVGNCDVGAVGVIVDSLKKPTVVGVVAGAGLGGFCQTKIKPPVKTHSPMTPQPKPLRMNRSKIAKNFLEDSLD